MSAGGFIAGFLVGVVLAIGVVVLQYFIRYRPAKRRNQ